MANIHPFRPLGGPPSYAHLAPAAQAPPLIIIGLLVAGMCALADWLAPTRQPRRTCGVCGRAGHDRRTCPHDGERLKFPRAVPKSKSCRCCGSSRYDIERHHTRGRANLSDFLDVCNGCHLDCCHGGDFQNIGIKPHNCRITGRRSVWRS